MDSARGQLLIAGPSLIDPNFWRTVVLVVEHSDEGALRAGAEPTVGDERRRGRTRSSRSCVDPAERAVHRRSRAAVLGGDPGGEFEDPATRRCSRSTTSASSARRRRRRSSSAGVRVGARIRRPRRLGCRAARRRARARRLDPRAGAARGRVLRRRRATCGRRCSPARAAATRWSRGCRSTRR